MACRVFSPCSEVKSRQSQAKSRDSSAREVAAGERRSLVHGSIDKEEFVSVQEHAAHCRETSISIVRVSWETVAMAGASFHSNSVANAQKLRAEIDPRSPRGFHPSMNHTPSPHPSTECAHLIGGNACSFKFLSLRSLRFLRFATGRFQFPPFFARHRWMVSR